MSEETTTEEISMVDKLFTFVGKTIAGILVYALGVVVRGYVVSWLWLWFIVPLWGLAALTVNQSIGLSFIIAVLTHGSKKKKESDISFFKIVIDSIILNLSILFLGWMLYQLI